MINVTFIDDTGLVTVTPNRGHNVNRLRSPFRKAVTVTGKRIKYDKRSLLLTIRASLPSPKYQSHMFAGYEAPAYRQAGVSKTGKGYVK